MARTKTKPKTEAPFARQRATAAEKESRWQIVLRLPHLVLLWALVSGLLVTSFLVGWGAGRTHGIQMALDQSTGTAARIPVAEVVAPSEQEAIEAVESVDVERTLQSPSAKIVSLREETDSSNYDFSHLSAEKSKAKAASPALPPVGFQQRGANSVNLGEANREIGGAKAKTLEDIQGAESDKKGSQKPTFRVKNEVSSGHYIQLAAYRNLSEAEELSARLDAGEYEINVVEAVVRERLFYRVLIGPYASNKLAESKLASLSKLPSLPGEPFVRKF